MLSGQDIICLSTHYWDERWFRKQEFMSRFARTNRVLFVEPSISMARGAEGHLAEIATNRFLVSSVEDRGQVHLLKPPRGLPKWSNARVEELTYRWFGRVVGRASRRLSFRDPILWLYRPAFLPGLSSVPHAKLVFDLVDDLAAYTDDPAMQSRVERQVTELARRSDLLVVTAKTLLERYGPLAASAVQVPNGFDGDLFAPGREREPLPFLESLPRPIIGFIGTLFSFLDFELLEAVARANPDKTMVLVGPVEENAVDALTALIRAPNVHHLGRQPQSTMPGYIAQFDVCLNPFRKSRVSDSVNPLKVYEYLAAGKPVVSTPMEALRQEEAGRVVAFADGSEAFSKTISSVLVTDDDSQAEERRRVAAAYTWDRLFERVEEACEAALAVSTADRSPVRS